LRLCPQKYSSFHKTNPCGVSCFLLGSISSSSCSIHRTKTSKKIIFVWWFLSYLMEG
jgi:hypothetical protein